jgi:DTW domain-containing protein YfiP
MEIDYENPSPVEDKPCDACGRVYPYCVCELTTPIATTTQLLILQHPQEPGVDIGTAPILRASFPGTVLRTGLSWPNLHKALGREAENRRWGVLYLGSVRVEDLPKDRALFVVDKKGAPRDDGERILSALEGIVVLDGTWSQAKTLWWRNAWLLKLPRLVIRSSRRSLYDKIRKEPRFGCLSTVETVGEVLAALERRDDIQPLLDKPLNELIERLIKNRPPGASKGPRRDWRNRRYHRGRR